MQKIKRIQKICPALVLASVLVFAAAAASLPSEVLANGSHRDCEEDSSGSHRHLPSGERIPCARDALQNPGSRRDTEQNERDEISTNPSRSELGATKSTAGTATRTPQMRTNPSRAMRRDESRPRR